MRDDEVKIQLRVVVDKCLAIELVRLNVQGITTTYSCCGHGGKRPAHMAVDEPDIPRMLEMGYKAHKKDIPHIRKPDGTIIPIEGPKPYVLDNFEPGDDLVLPGDGVTFEPKSTCRCADTDPDKNRATGELLRCHQRGE